MFLPPALARLNCAAAVCYLPAMSSVAEIESAIEKLPPQERRQLRDWLVKQDEPKQGALQKLRSLAGAARNLPADLAANHDHYLHGAAKRS